MGFESAFGRRKEERSKDDLTSRINEQLNDVELIKDPAGNLLAPNGKPSLLRNDVLWKWVRTPAFKEWFGDWEKPGPETGALLDKNGEPRLFFHGSKDIFYPYRGIPWRSRLWKPTQGAYTFFTPTFSTADYFGGANVTACFLNSRELIERENVSEEGYETDREYRAILRREKRKYRRIKNNPDDRLARVQGSSSPLGGIFSLGVVHPEHVMAVPMPLLARHKVDALRDRNTITRVERKYDRTADDLAKARESEERLGRVDRDKHLIWSVREGIANLVEDIRIDPEMRDRLAKTLPALFDLPASAVNTAEGAREISQLAASMLQAAGEGILRGRDPLMDPLEATEMAHDAMRIHYETFGSRVFRFTQLMSDLQMEIIIAKALSGAADERMKFIGKSGGDTIIDQREVHARISRLLPTLKNEAIAILDKEMRSRRIPQHLEAEAHAFARQILTVAIAETETYDPQTSGAPDLDAQAHIAKIKRSLENLTAIHRALRKDDRVISNQEFDSMRECVKSAFAILAKRSAPRNEKPES